MGPETGANEEWSPIRDAGDQAGAMVSVLAAAEGENGALLGLARGMIIPLVKDDLSMLGGGLFLTSVAQEEKGAPELDWFLCSTPICKAGRSSLCSD